MFKSKLYMKLLTENKVVQNVLYLMNQTNCLDVKAMSVKLLNMILTNPTNTTNELDVAQYISKIIWNQSSADKNEIEIEKILAPVEQPKEPILQKPGKAPQKISFVKTANLPELENIEEPEKTTSFATTAQISKVENADFKNSDNPDVDKKLEQQSKNLRNANKKTFEFGAPKKSFYDTASKDAELNLEKKSSTDSDTQLTLPP